MSARMAVIIALMLPTPALAEDWQDRVHWADKAIQAPPGQHYRPARPEVHRAPVVRSYVRRERVHRPAPLAAGEPDKACKAPIKVVGDQRPTLEGAREQADKAWMQEVRFRFGERFMETVNARDRRYACSRSSIAEIVGQTMQRCEIIALPCPAPVLWGAK